MMAFQKTITKCLAVFLVLGFITFAIPLDSNAGIGPPEIEPGCCQFFVEGSLSCANSFGLCRTIPGGELLDFIPGGTCNEQTGTCSGFAPTSSVPTLSEWGMIAMAGVLGLVGFMVVRRKRVTA